MSTAAVNKSHPVPLPLMGRTSLDADTSVWPHHTYLMLGQRICSPEDQNDISIGTVRRCGSDLALNWVPHGEFVGLQGERQGGITGVNAHSKVLLQTYWGQLCTPCLGTSAHLSLSAILFQRAPFKYNPRPFPSSEISLCLLNYNLHFLLFLWEVYILLHVSTIQNRHLSGWSGIMIYWRRVHYQ